MRNRWAAAVAVACCAAVIAAAPAFASMLASLQTTQTKGYYGQETMLTPSVEASIVPGATFELQASKDASSWALLGELQGVEETGTVDPFYNIWDNSISYPIYVRVAFRSKGTSAAQAPNAVTQPVRLYALKYLSTRVGLAAAKTAYLNKPYKVAVQVTPVSGEGKLKVDRFKFTGGRWVFLKSYVLATDEVGAASMTLHPGAKGSYRLRARFAGNQFSVASPYAYKSYVVR